MVRRMVREFTIGTYFYKSPGRMVLDTKESGQIIKSTEKEFTNGTMAENTTESGLIIISMVMGYTHGLKTEENMKDNM